MKEGRNCATCANWFPITPSAAAGSSELTVASGECHRYAPRPLLADRDTPPALFWPTTRADDVCGEWYYGGLHTDLQASGRARLENQTPEAMQDSPLKQP